MHPADQVVVFTRTAGSGQPVPTMTALLGMSKRIVGQQDRLVDATPELLRPTHRYQRPRDAEGPRRHHRLRAPAPSLGPGLLPLLRAIEPPAHRGPSPGRVPRLPGSPGSRPFEPMAGRCCVIRSRGWTKLATSADERRGVYQLGAGQGYEHTVPVSLSAAWRSRTTTRPSPRCEHCLRLTSKRCSAPASYTRCSYDLLSSPTSPGEWEASVDRLGNDLTAHV